MLRRLASFVLAALAVVILHGVFLALPAPALAAGATQIGGVAYADDGSICADPAGAGAGFILRLTGDLTGCLYQFIETAECRPSGTYFESGTELFIGTYKGQAGSFATTYNFEAKYQDCPSYSVEIFGRCQHPITAGSGAGVFAGVSGRLAFKDDVETGEFFYRGHLRY